MSENTARQLTKVFSTRKILWHCLSVAVMVAVFSSDAFISNDGGFYKGFGRESETLVLGKILADKNEINTNRYGLGCIFSGEFEYPAKVLDSYTLMNSDEFFFTDANWEKGISRQRAGFFVQNRDDNTNKFEVGRIVEFKNGDKREIVEIVRAGEYLYVYLSGAVLKYKEVGLPSGFSVYGIDKYATNLNYLAYKSSFGLQGRFFSALSNTFGIYNIEYLRLINTVFLSIVLVYLCSLIGMTYNKILSAGYYFVFLLSPWMTAFAGNLFWVPFTWFLPALFLFLLHQNPNKMWQYLMLFFLSVLIKSLCGYEYLSTILWFSAVPFLVDVLSVNNFAKWKRTVVLVMVIAGLSVLAFLLAVFIHASIRADSVIAGIQDIWAQDVLRRTYGNPESFSPIYAESLLASPWQVIKKYLIWNTEIITGISGKYYILLVFCAFMILCYRTIKKSEADLTDVKLFIVLLIGPLTWFVLAKSHSFIHTHINFILWYFGFIQIVFYILIVFLYRIMRKCTLPI